MNIDVKDLTPTYLNSVQLFDKFLSITNYIRCINYSISYLSI